MGRTTHPWKFVPSGSDDMARANTGRRSDRWMAYGFMMPAAILVGPFLVWPIIDTFRESLFSTSFINPVPSFVGLATYRKIFGDPEFWQVVVNSIVWTAGVVSLQHGGGVSRLLPPY